MKEKEVYNPNDIARERVDLEIRKMHGRNSGSAQWEISEEEFQADVDIFTPAAASCLKVFRQMFSGQEYREMREMLIKQGVYLK